MSEEKNSLPVFQKGDKLRTERGATAKVISVEKDKNKPHSIVGYNVEIAELGKPVRTALLQNGALVAWHLDTRADASIALDPAKITQAQLDHEWTMEQFGHKSTTAAAPVEDSATAVISQAMLTEKEAAVQQLQSQLDIISHIAAARLAENTQLETDLKNVRDVLAINYEAYDELQNQMLAAAMRIAQLETENADLIEARDSAIAMYDVASERAHDIADELKQYERAGAPADCKEFKIVHHISAADLVKNEREDWVIEHMQFVGGEDSTDRLNVVYSRIVTPPAPQPERKAAVAAVGPHIVMQPIDRLPVPERVEAYMQSVYAEANAAAFEAANEALAELQPLRDAIANRPTLSLTANAVHPQVRS